MFKKKNIILSRT